MPRIILKQKTGSYGVGDHDFEAGKIYDVDYPIANYVVNEIKVADEVKPIETDLKPPPKIIPAQEPPFKETKSKPLNHPLNIALVRFGGIGDSLILSGLAVAIKRKYSNSKITVYIRDSDSASILQDNPFLDVVVSVGNKNIQQFMDKFVLPKEFDIVYDIRYMTKVYYKDLERFKEDKEKTDSLFKDYEEHFNAFPIRNNELWEKFKISSYDLMLKTTGLTGSPDDLYIHLSPQDRAMLPLLAEDRYVTVHNGADISRQTKCWTVEHWNAIVIYLKSKGYKAIQLGKSLEEPIAGTLDMRGKVTLKQSAALISGARFHIDSEGGLVYIARAMGIRSIVLFGPTNVDFFKYNSNINVVTPYECKDCWWTNDMWWRECPKKYPHPVPCMHNLLPSLVEKAIRKIQRMPPFEKEPAIEEKIDNAGEQVVVKAEVKEDLNEKFARECILDEAYYLSNPWQMDRVVTMMSQVVGKKVLEVGAGDGYGSEVLKKRGFDITATEVSPIRLERMKNKGVDCVYGDVNSLPFPDASFDTVICGEVLEHIDSIGKGLSELERVCKPDGKIIISLPVALGFRAIRMHLWGITHHAVLRDGKLDMVVLELERINRLSGEKK